MCFQQTWGGFLNTVNSMQEVLKTCAFKCDSMVLYVEKGKRAVGEPVALLEHLP